ncbi:MAG: hypothetical protein ACRC1M_00280, partial [Methanobacteriaceae archaeon]
MKWKMIFLAVLGLAMALAIFTSFSPISAAVVTNGTVVSVNGSNTINEGIGNLTTSGNGTIYLNDKYYNGSGNVGIGINGNRNITIIGNGTGSNGTVIDGNGASRIFNIQTGNSLTLINLTIINS